MSDVGESLFQFIYRHAELIKAREAERASYPGDGLTTEQADSLVGSLRPIIEATDPVPLSTRWAAFRLAVDSELS